MAKFIELTQQVDTNSDGIIERKVRVNIERIDFFCEKRIVFGNGGIDVLESYEEIIKRIHKACIKIE